MHYSPSSGVASLTSLSVGFQQPISRMRSRSTLWPLLKARSNTGQKGGSLQFLRAFSKTKELWNIRGSAAARSAGRERRPNNAFKPKLHRYANNMAERACHVLGYALQFGLT